MLTNFEKNFSDYQMVECFRHFGIIFIEIRYFFDREITDLFVSRINRHPVGILPLFFGYLKADSEKQRTYQIKFTC